MGIPPSTISKRLKLVDEKKRDSNVRYKRGTLTQPIQVQTGERRRGEGFWETKGPLGPTNGGAQTQASAVCCEVLWGEGW